MAQQTVGERGIGVQIGGDGNIVTVYAGLAELNLLRKHARRSNPKPNSSYFASISGRRH
jgi:hypothetical protein